LIAENHPPATVNSRITPNAAPGTVRATSLGVNASRVVYSPTPSYPPAASAAHVQGEVKLEASVDSHGNVVSVRVISGPPVLREAAMDAAQRWRYRPNMEDGEPTAMSAITVFAFQLP
jgi:TonB family protein